MPEDPLDRPMLHVSDLAFAFNLQREGWVADLFRLIDQADPTNRTLLGLGFPRHVGAYALWQATTPAPTGREFREALDRLGWFAWLDDDESAGVPVPRTGEAVP